MLMNAPYIQCESLIAEWITEMNLLLSTFYSILVLFLLIWEKLCCPLFLSCLSFLLLNWGLTRVA